MPNPNPELHPENLTPFEPGNPGGPGRRPIDADTGTGKKTIQVVVPGDLAQWYATRVEKSKTHKSVSEYVRDLLLKHKEETGEP